MLPRYSFKSDESFLEKIAIGAAGAQRVFADLQGQGHRPLELERGSLGYKIWKTIKIKRIRVPDILCVNCGRRVESRAKTKGKFVIAMSNSESDPDRRWDYGLDEEDFVAFPVCEKVGERPIDWKALHLVQYVPVPSLKRAQSDGNVVSVKPKGAEEGFESRLVWPATIANYAGEVTETTSDNIKYRRLDDGRTISARLVRDAIPLIPEVTVGQSVSPTQVIASVVRVTQMVPCATPPLDATFYINWLASPSQSKRYAAAKALALYNSPRVESALQAAMTASDEHVYVRLEAATSLTKLGNPAGMEFVSENLRQAPLEPRLEAVITLGELGTEEAVHLLVQVLMDIDQAPEIRAGAAWALGELGNKEAIDALVKSFNTTSEDIRVEAARALAKLATSYTAEIAPLLATSSPLERPGVAWALSKSKEVTIEDMLAVLVDENARQWVAYVLGTQDQQRLLSGIESLRTRDPEVYFAVTVLWRVMSSWVFTLEEY